MLQLQDCYWHSLPCYHSCSCTCDCAIGSPLLSLFMVVLSTILALIVVVYGGQSGCCVVHVVAVAFLLLYVMTYISMHHGEVAVGVLSWSLLEGRMLAILR